MSLTVGALGACDVAGKAYWLTEVDGDNQPRQKHAATTRKARGKNG